MVGRSMVHLLLINKNPRPAVLLRPDGEPNEGE